MATHRFNNGLLEVTATPGSFVSTPVEIPVVPASPTAITQTYATADTTQPAPTAAALVLTATAIAAKTASLTLTESDVASLAAMKVTNDQLAKDVGTAVNKNTDDVLALNKVVVTLIDTLQAAGLLA